MQITVAGLIVLATAMSVRAGDAVDYVRDVKPILTRYCYECHGAQKQRAGLRLDTAAAALRGGDSGPALVPGKAAESKLIQAVTGAGDLKLMPPKEPRLSSAQVSLLRNWIDQGARAPKDEKVPATKVHWAFQPVRGPAVPVVRNTPAVRNPIDAFIVNRLEREGIAPSPEADRSTLLRRVSLDLIGLPPSPAEVDAFVRDPRPDAYERLVDRLLASPHYGERWARHWLDLARYADSNGYSIDAPRSIWPYRDWVIAAFNRDLPFDQFTIQQLAGDLLPQATHETKVATGFHRNTGINQEGGINVEQFRVESIVDRVNTTGTVWLGLTVGCAQCHDHKYDPLSQKEYYQLFAFLNNDDEPVLELATPEQVRQREAIGRRIADVERKVRVFDQYSATAEDRWEKKLSPEARMRLPAAIQTILDVPENGRTAPQKQTLTGYYKRLDWARHAVGGLASPLPFVGLAHAQAAKFRAGAELEMAQLRRGEPKVVTTMVLQQRKAPRKTHVLLGGDFLREGAEVRPGFPRVVSANAQELQPLGLNPSTRLDLARWIVDSSNPLTPRVTVNRFWQHFFGLGLVETENDFGAQGTPPSHPELLDWLAGEFVRQGWSVKSLHRLIVTSATYRQSSRARPELAVKDPRNRLLARQSRLRLDAEVVRDVGLAASGLLAHEVGGPSVFPPQPGGVYSFTQIKRDWRPSPGPDRYRRGMYTYFWRSAPHPALVAFDAPDATLACTRRNRSNTPLQALTLLNDEGYFELARATAGRVLREAGADDHDRIRHAFRLCLARAPSPREDERLAALLGQARTDGDTEAVTWTTIARVLLNLDEFITRE